MTRPTSVVLLLGGDDAGPAALAGARDAASGALVVAADSGLHLAAALGLVADHVVGDLDSADPALVAAAEAAGATIHRHLADKDATDSELAVDVVRSLAEAEAVVGSSARPAGVGVEAGSTAGAAGVGVEAGSTAGAAGVGGEAGSTAGAAGSPTPDRATDGGPVPLLVLGGGGGRLDHLFADLLLLASPALAGFEVTARLGAATVTIVRPGRPRQLAGVEGEQVSVLPIHGRARGVDTDGLRWALVDADLVAGTTRAVSNELVGSSAVVAVGAGVLAVVQPGTVAPPIPERPTPYDPTPVDPTA